MDLKKIVGSYNNKGLEEELKANRYYRIISEIQKLIHRRIPVEEFDTAKVATTSDIREEIFNGVNSKRVVIYLLSNGCEWALKSAHGCMMCGHLGKQTRRSGVISPEDFIKQFNEEYKKIDFSKSPLLNIYNNGSFLNDREMPKSARIEILKTINANPDIKMLVLETRPEFVVEEKIMEIKELLPGKHVEIAIGLELKNDLYRSVCINKGFSLASYNSAAFIITKYLNLRTYVFLKPPFLSERESIEQAVETIDHAFRSGSTTVSLEACTIQNFTFVKSMFDMKLYTPPWIWSIIDVVRRSSRSRKLVIGLFQFYPSPSTIPYNCPKCSQNVMEAMRRYNSTLDPYVLDGLDCECKAEWQRILREKHPPFEERLRTTIEKLIKHFPVEKEFITSDSL